MMPPTGPIEFDLTRADVLLPLAAAAKLGLSERQVYVLVRRLRAAQGDPAALQRGKSNGGRGQSRLAPATDQAVDQIIADALASARDRPIADIIAAIQRHCRARQVPPPSASTIRRRLKTFNDSRVGGRQTTEAADAILLASLNDTVGNPAGWASFLGKLTAGSYFNRATLSLRDAALRSGYAGAQFGFDPSFEAPYASHYAVVNPWLAEPKKRSLGIVLTSEAVVPDADLLRTEYYSDLCRPNNFDLAVAA
jgi:hypothetical protein